MFFAGFILSMHSLSSIEEWNWWKWRRRSHSKRTEIVGRFHCTRAGVCEYEREKKKEREIMFVCLQYSGIWYINRVFSFYCLSSRSVERWPNDLYNMLAMGLIRLDSEVSFSLGVCNCFFRSFTFTSWIISCCFVKKKNKLNEWIDLREERNVSGIKLIFWTTNYAIRKTNEMSKWIVWHEV